MVLVLQMQKLFQEILLLLKDEVGSSEMNNYFMKYYYQQIGLMFRCKKYFFEGK